MRKITTFLTVFFLIAFTTSLSAQEFRGGIVAGIAGTQVLGDGYSGPNKAGINVGPYVNLALTDRASIQMQLEFMQKGSRENPDSTNNYESYKLRLNYVQIPIMFQYRYNEKFGFEAGGSYGVLISSYEEALGYTGPLLTGKEFKERDVSFHAGMHYYINEQLKAEIEFSHSLLAIREFSTTGPTLLFNQGEYNHVLLLAVQYQINNLFGY
ncbi:MAG: PorT family protein [Bacteroidales bacterium]|nr:PorT family protein [Bacteroidales bacterium]